MAPRSRRNPAVGEHPDLFGGSSRVVRAIELMSEEELRRLPKRAFSKEEWDSLDDMMKVHIIARDPEAQAEAASREERIQNCVAQFVARHKWAEEPDRHHMVQMFDEDFDGQFAEYADRIIRRARDSGYSDEIDTLEEDFAAKGYSPEQINAALEEALQNNNNYHYNYDASEYGGAMFKAGYSESFYVDREDLNDWLDGLSEDEIEEVLNQVNRATYLNLDANDLDRKYGIDISDYVQHYADADPVWDMVEAAVKETLDAQDLEGLQEAEPPVPEAQRVLHRFKDGFYALELEPSEMPNESDQMHHCIGRKDHEYMSLVRRGKAMAISLRRPSGKPLLTFFVSLAQDGTPKSVEQIKGKSNRLPGWDLGKVGEGAVKTDEVKKAETIIEILELDPMSVTDLRPGLQALKGLPVPRENPRRRVHCGFCNEPA